eukprot:RCo026440
MDSPVSSLPMVPQTPTKSPYSTRSAQLSPGKTPTSPWSSPKSRLTADSDRYIPCRRSIDFDIANFNLTHKENVFFPPDDDNVANFHRNLAESLFEDRPIQSVLSACLSPGKATPKSTSLTRHNHSLRVMYNQNRSRNFKSKSYRVIPQTPERILDAPELLDDYYLNLLDWSMANILTVALNRTVYLWNADTGAIQLLHTTPEENNIITSVSWCNENNQLALGTNFSEVQLWDATAVKRVRSLKNHAGRVGSLSWNGVVLASGSRDSTVMIHDTRMANSAAHVLTAHNQEVCGLRWAPDGVQLASGGNDNLLHVWDAQRWERPRLALRSHTAAVKALGWSPHQSNLLASGGGTQDRTLRFWNTSSGACLHSIDTKSQVCAVMWSKHSNELVTSHGFSENQLSLWRYPTLSRVADLTGHTSRVLHMAMSPDGQMVVSAAGDETIRFWKCFAAEPKRCRVSKPASGRYSLSSEDALKIR